jgi:hypothetical protein
MKYVRLEDQVVYFSDCGVCMSVMGLPPHKRWCRPRLVAPRLPVI